MWDCSTYLANTLSRAEFYTASRRRLPCRWRILLCVGFRVARYAEPCAWFKMQGYEALWASAAHSPRLATSGGSPTLPCAAPILECDRGRSLRHPCEGGLVPDGPRGERGRASVERNHPCRVRRGSTGQR